MPAFGAEHHHHDGLTGDLTADRVAAPKDGREAASLGTEKSRTWVKPDGSRVTRIWNRPVNVKTEKGWEAIDNSLKASAGGGFLKGVGGYDLRVPSTLAQPLRLRDGERFIELKLQGSAAAAKVAGPKATFAGAGKGASLEITAFDDAIKEDLVLAGTDSQNSFTYEVGLSAGLKLELRKDGGADVVDANGRVAFAIPAPVAQDAKGAIAADGDASLSYESGKLTVSLSKDWLTEQGRAFPVRLDPSAVLGATRDTFTDEITPTSGYATVGDLYAGREGAGHDHNALTYFDVAAHVPKGAFVQEAELNLWPKYQTAATGTKNLEARAITSGWDANATWVKRNATTNWGTAGGDLGAVLDTEPAGLSAWKRFAVTDTVTSWLDGSATNNGLAIGDGASTVDRAVVFASSEWVDAPARPYLEVQYFPRAGAQPNYTIHSESIANGQGIGVNVAGGNLLLQSDDLSVDAKGLPVEVSRAYNSMDDWSGQFGQGGRISLGNDIVLHECDGLGSRCLIGPSGFRARFKFNGTAKYETPANLGNLSLTRATATSGEFTLTDNETGTKWKFFDNSFSFNNKITDRHGNSLLFEASNPGGSLSKITDANGRQYPIVTDSGGRITKISAPTSTPSNPVAWQYAYNPYGFMTSVTDPEGYVTQYAYGANDKINKITDARGNDTLIAYDAHNRVTSVTRKIDGTTTNDITTTFAYVPVDADCNENGAANPKVVGKTEITDPNGNKTKYCYQQSGSVAKALNAKGHETDTKYTSVGNASSIMGFAGTGNANAETKYDFGSGGGYNLTQIDGAAGEQTKIDYPNMSGGTPPTDPLDEFRPTKVTDPDGKITQFQYTNGNPTNISSGANASLAHRSVQMTWNTDGTLATSKVNNEATRVTTYGYDSFGRLTSITPPNPTITPARTFTYDGLSRVKTATDGRGKTTTFGYDKLDRVTTITDNGTITQTFGFDANGNLTSRTEPGKVSSFTYDKLNRRTGDTLPGSVTNAYTWDKASNLKTLTDVSGTVHYGYDQLNRTNSMDPDGSGGESPTTWDFTDPTGGSSATSAYVTQFLPGGGKIKSTADLSGKLTEVLVTNAGSAQTLKRNYNYSTYQTTAGAEHELLDWADEQDGAGAPVTTKVYDYDDSVQLTRASTYDSAGNLTARDELTINAYGNRTKRVRTVGASTTTRTYEYNIANQLCWYVDAVSTNGCGAPPAGATSFTYDAEGNQLTGGTAATYDDKGRLATLGGSALTHLSSSNVELTGLGTSTFRNALLGVGTITVGGNVSRLQRNPDDGGVVSQTRDGERRWFVTDHLGSTIGLASSNGNIQRKYDYSVDGEDTPSGTGSTTWIRYAGGHDLGNGLYHFGQRYYNPTIARWTQRDPVDQPDDLVNQNAYVYAGNNPVNFTDPAGDIPILGLVAAGRALYYAGRAAKASGMLRTGATAGERYRVAIGHTPQRAATATSRGAHVHIGTRTVGGSVYGRSNWSALYKSRGGGPATRKWNKPKPKYKGPKEGE